MSYGEADAGRPAEARSRVDAGVLWAGGAATAVVAALVAAVGALICDSLLDVTLIPVWGHDVLTLSDRAALPVGAAVTALLATALLHLLLVAVPSPVRFFNWVVALVAIAFAVAPFGYDATTKTQVATAVVDFVVVVSIGILLRAAARRACRPQVIDPRP